MNIWLVVDLPLWKMMEFVSWDDDIPNIWGKHVPNHQPDIWGLHPSFPLLCYTTAILGEKKLRSPTHGSEHRAPWKIRTPGIKNNMDHEDGISWVSWLTSWISSWQTSRYKYHGFHNQIYIYIYTYIYIYIIFSPKTRWKELLNREASSRSVWIQEISRHRIVGL